MLGFDILSPLSNVTLSYQLPFGHVKRKFSFHGYLALGVLLNNSLPKNRADEKDTKYSSIGKKMFCIM